MDMYNYELKIPKERIAVVIGKDGAIKKELEETTKTKLRIDSKEGDIFIVGEDALGLYTAREIVQAIGRGFSPDTALHLLKQDYVFETMHLLDYAKSKEAQIRIKGRVIGREGKARKCIEELTETYISVFGKTIGIIGNSESVAIARRAIDALLRGATHASVFQWLERKRKQMKKREMLEL